VSFAFARVLFITLVLQVAVYALRPMVSYEAISFGASNFELGIIASAFALLSLPLAVSIGRWIDRWGAAWFVIAGAAMISAVSLLLLFIDDIWVLVASQAILGLGHILSVIGSQTLVANQASRANRDGRFGVFTVIVSLGQLIGPGSAGFLAGSTATEIQSEAGEVGTDAVFILAALVALTGVIVAFTIPRGKLASPVKPQGKGGPSGTAQRSTTYWESVTQVLRIPSMPQAMLASLTVLTTIDLLAVYLPAFGEARGIPVETIGLLLAVRAGASMASRLLLLPMLRILSLARVLAISTAMPAVALGLFPFLEPLPLLYLAIGVAGFGLGLGQPITLTWVAGRVPRKSRGTALGVRHTGNRLGQVVLPVTVGLVAGASGVALVFSSLAVLLGVTTLSVLTAKFDRYPPEEEPAKS
jgi:MFS family permease